MEVIGFLYCDVALKVNRITQKATGMAVITAVIVICAFTKANLLFV